MENMPISFTGGVGRGGVMNRFAKVPCVFCNGTCFIANVSHGGTKLKVSHYLFCGVASRYRFFGGVFPVWKCVRNGGIVINVVTIAGPVKK